MTTASQPIDFSVIPPELRSADQWVLWKSIDRDGKATKVPFTVDGGYASSTNAATWSDFESVAERFSISADDYSGVGFVFGEQDDFCGVDFDGCRNPETGEIDDWAMRFVRGFDSYTEVSPSGTGVKIFFRTQTDFKGSKIEVDVPATSNKTPAVEVYRAKRYFTVTGLHVPSTPQAVTVAAKVVLDELFRAFFSKAKPKEKAKESQQRVVTRVDLVERCWRYVQKMPDALSGHDGHGRTFAVACVCFRFGLTDGEAEEILRRFNATKTGDDQWSDNELAHKLESARNEVTRSGEFGLMSRDESQGRVASTDSKKERQPLAADTLVRTRERETCGKVVRDNGETVDVSFSDNEGEFTTTVPIAELLDEHGNPVEKGLVERGAKPDFVNLILSSELCKLDLKPCFIVKNVMVERQPLVVGGPSKTLKTSVTLDLAISLATGTPFLGQFETLRRRVAIWSGESGAATLRETGSRISAARGIDLKDTDILWAFSLPKLSQEVHLTYLEQCIIEQKIEVAIVDPLYLALLSPEMAGSAGNVYAMGSALQPLSEIGQRTGATIVVLHHFKKNGGDRNGDAEPASLEMLSQAGIVEWARQWILLQRQSAYQADGKHSLWMRAGGSAGHAGLYSLAVEEGTIDPESMSGRTWNVELKTSGAAWASEKQQRQRAKQEAEAKRDWDDLELVLETLRLYPNGETLRTIRDEAKMKTDRCRWALTRLEREGYIEHTKVTKNKRPEDGYQLKKQAGGDGGDGGNLSTSSPSSPVGWGRPFYKKGVPPPTEDSSLAGNEHLEKRPHRQPQRFAEFDQFNNEVTS